MFSQLLKISNYYFNPYAIPVILASILILSIGLFVLKQNRRSIINMAFFLQCFSVSFWLLTISIVYLSRTQHIALFWYRYFTFFGVLNIMPSVYLFSVAWAGEFKRKKIFVIVNYIIPLIFYVLEITTDKIIIPHEIRKYFWGFYPVYGIWAISFLIFFSMQFFVGFRKLYLSYRFEKIPIKMMQLKVITIATFIAFIASLDFIPKFFYLPLYPFGYIPMLTYITLVAYSIVRYRTFDIETVIHKTIMWIFTFSFILIPVLFLYRWLLPHIRESTMLQIGFWVIGFLIFALYLRVIQPRIDHLFQRRQSNLEEISNRFTEDLVHLKGLNQLIQRIKDTIADTLYPQKIDIYIYRKEEKDSPFLQWLTKNNKIIYREFIEIDPKYTSIREEAKDYFNQVEAIVVIPLVLNEKLLGILNLGKKSNLKRYSALDFQFLTTLKNQSAIAISNSLLYESIEEQVRQRTKELVDVQRQLIQAEKLATMGTLAGGVAHEINNPLTAILTNVQMLLLTANSLDADSNESLELIEEATKRCRTIVQKLMAYAKKPLELTEISKVNLLTVTKNVVSFLGYQLEQDNIKIITLAKENDYTVMGNQNELEQVLTNIILNAKDTIKQIKKGGNIQIRLFKNDDWVNVEIKDEGRGIPKEIMPKIFDPFFTTKDVGKGTGLGLSICQAIIEKHKGLITAQSETGKGSIFTIKIPAAKQESALKA